MAISLQIKLITIFLIPIIFLEIILPKHTSQLAQKQKNSIFYNIMFWLISFITVNLILIIIFFGLDFNLFFYQLFAPHLNRLILERNNFTIISNFHYKINKLQLFRGKGCQHCFNTGYLGKTVIAEVLQFSQKIHELILSGAEEQLIKKQARLEGMQTLRESGLDAVLRGQTTIEEALCVSAPDA